MWRVADDFIAAQDDKTSPAITRGLEQMRNGCAEVLGGALTSFSERPPYEAHDLAVFAHDLMSTFPALTRRLTTPARKAALDQLRKIAASERDPELARALNELLRATVAAR